MKNKVVIITRGDWAGSGYFASQAINSIGRIECRHITFHPHIYNYPTDILIPKCWIPKEYEMPSVDDIKISIAEANKAIEEASLIHIWNEEIPSFKGIFNFPTNKVKSYTFTGSYYRRQPGHAKINANLIQNKNNRIVIQNPSYVYPKEFPISRVEFIPHAIDTKKFSLRGIKKELNTIGCYRPKHESTTAVKDIDFLQGILKNKFTDWKITCGERTTWDERLKQLKKAILYFEYMDPNLGYWGRSAIEACAFGIPTLSYISKQAKEFAGERLGDIGIVAINHEVLEKKLTVLITNEAKRKEVGDKARKWIEQYFSYNAVGELYTQFFEKLI